MQTRFDFKLIVKMIIQFGYNKYKAFSSESKITMIHRNPKTNAKGHHKGQSKKRIFERCAFL